MWTRIIRLCHQKHRNSEHSTTTSTVRLPVCLYLCVPTLVDTASSRLLDQKGTKKKRKKKVKRFEAAVTHSTGGNQHSASFGFPCLKPKLTMNYDPCRLHFVRRSGSCRFSIYARRLYALQLSSRREQLSP